jgi:N-acetylmuramoyl-L-alanine amidase
MTNKQEEERKMTFVQFAFVTIIVLVMMSMCQSCKDPIVPEVDTPLADTIMDVSVIDLAYYSSDMDEDYSLMDIPTRGNKTRYYNFHCTASKEGIDLDGAWFLRFFRNDRGWKNPGYNGIILLDGTLEKLHPYNMDGYTTRDEISNGVKGRNSVSLNFAYVGGVDKFLRSKDTRTPAQIKTMTKLAYQLRCSDSEAIFMGHRDHMGVSKACPSFDVNEEYPEINPMLNLSDLFDYSDNYDENEDN